MRVRCETGNVAVDISFRDALVAEIDAQAKRESRSRSELLRQAAWPCVRRQRQRAGVFALGDRQAARLGLTEAMVKKEICAARGRKC